jgi:type IV secretory pathway TrbF-like protein
MQTSKTENPYVKGNEGRKEWNDRYGSMQQAIRKWQMAFFFAMAISIIFALVIAKIATSSQVKPFIVETNRGMPIAISSMRALSDADPRIINFAVNQFIINTRSVIHDTTAEKTLLNKAYAFSADQTIHFLQDYYQKNNPFTLSAEHTVTVQIINSLPISSRTWQVTWDETKHSNRDDRILSVTRWVAQLSYQFGKVNPKFINDNPFGIYMTHISWSQSQVGGENAN